MTARAAAIFKKIGKKIGKIPSREAPGGANTHTGQEPASQPALSEEERAERDTERESVSEGMAGAVELISLV
jgi:hypothetical protein